MPRTDSAKCRYPKILLIILLVSQNPANPVGIPTGLPYVQYVMAWQNNKSKGVLPHEIIHGDDLRQWKYIM